MPRPAISRTLSQTALLGWMGIVIGLFSLKQATAQERETGPLIILTQFDTTYIEIHPEYWIDSTGQLTIDSLSQYLPLQLQAGEKIEPVRSEYPIWVRFHLHSQIPYPSTWYIHDRSDLDTMKVWYYGAEGLRKVLLNGKLVKWMDRAVRKYGAVETPLQIAAYDSVSVFLYLKAAEGVDTRISLEIKSELDWLREDKQFALTVIWAYIAVIVFMALYSLMVFGGTRDSTYLYYALYLLSIGGLIAFADGPHEIIFYPKWNPHILTLCACGVGIFYFQFARKFLHLSKEAAVWDKIIWVYVLIRLLLVGIYLIFVLLGRSTDWALMAILIFFIGDGLITLSIYPRLIRMKKRIAWYFILGSAFVFILGPLHTGISGLLSETGNANGNLLIIAPIIEILIFSLGLGFRVRDSEQKKLAAEKSLNSELSKVNTAFGRFVPHEFIHTLGHKSVMDIQLGDGVEKNVAVVFSDIRGYTSLAEQMSPQENFRFLNAYLGRMGPVIKEAGGFVNQYYGDGVMALFVENPAASLEACIRMLDVLRDYNQSRIKAHRAPIKIGTGIHFGKLMMGVIGDTLRLEAGVVSDTVNTAARMEGLTKHFGANIMLSKSVYAQLGGELQAYCRRAGKVRLKGRQTPLEVYECFAGDSPEIKDQKLAEKPDFERALDVYLEANFTEAKRLLQSLSVDSDPLLQLYLDRITAFKEQPPSEDWDGIDVLFRK